MKYFRSPFMITTSYFSEHENPNKHQNHCEKQKQETRNENKK